MDRRAKMDRLAAVASAFTPGAPVGLLDMLAGRMDQLTDVVSAVSMRGQHVGLYGERGVGKTSLATVLAEYFSSPRLQADLQAGVVNCSSDDSFSSLWHNIFTELGIDLADEYAALSPEGIRRQLQAQDKTTLIVIDELDRLEDPEALTALSDTIKTLSDHAVDSTLVLVGVGRSIGELVGEHQSIVRALVQIEMPRMTRRELAEILLKGCERAEVTIKSDAVDRITTLSEGLPHYTHLLGLHAGQNAVRNDRSEITVSDVEAAIPKAVDRHTIQDAYQQATRSARKDALFAQVLLACALAPKNQLGFFTSGSIRSPLAVIAEREIDIPAFSNHLSQFLEPARGSVLHREGTSRRYFYRFTDPIFQPYVVLTGLRDGLITHDQLRELGQDDDADESEILIPGEYEPNGPQQLF